MPKGIVQLTNAEAGRTRGATAETIGGISGREGAGAMTPFSLRRPEVAVRAYRL